MKNSHTPLPGDKKTGPTKVYAKESQSVGWFSALFGSTNPQQQGLLKQASQSTTKTDEIKTNKFQGLGNTTPTTENTGNKSKGLGNSK